MKRKLWSPLLIISTFLLLIISVCKKEEVPTLTTTGVSNVTAETATNRGNITDNGGSFMTARGVCWCTSPNPTSFLSTKTTDSTGSGAFTSIISGLAAGKTYYFMILTSFLINVHNYTKKF